MTEKFVRIFIYHWSTRRRSGNKAMHTVLFPNFNAETNIKQLDALCCNKIGDIPTWTHSQCISPLICIFFIWERGSSYIADCRHIVLLFVVVEFPEDDFFLAFTAAEPEPAKCRFSAAADNAASAFFNASVVFNKSSKMKKKVDI